MEKNVFTERESFEDKNYDLVLEKIALWLEEKHNSPLFKIRDSNYSITRAGKTYIGSCIISRISSRPKEILLKIKAMDNFFEDIVFGVGEKISQGYLNALKGNYTKDKCKILDPKQGKELMELLGELKKLLGVKLETEHYSTSQTYDYKKEKWGYGEHSYFGYFECIGIKAKNMHDFLVEVEQKIS